MEVAYLQADGALDDLALVRCPEVRLQLEDGACREGIAAAPVWRLAISRRRRARGG